MEIRRYPLTQLDSATLQCVTVHAAFDASATFKSTNVNAIRYLGHRNCSVGHEILSDGEETSDKKNACILSLTIM